MELNDGKKRVQFKKGDVYYARKNQLLKFVKYPLEGGEFKSLSIFFDEKILQDFSVEYGYKATEEVDKFVFTRLSGSKALSTFMQSLAGYEQALNSGEATDLVLLKQKEALLLLLKYDVSLKNVLFNFSAPHKIDLESFMQKNFHFNVSLERFAFLTGRSLSTFKRDFEKIFNLTPNRWLIHRRLQEAYYLITEKNRTPTDVYLDVGFENLSHFSFIFKKKFGQPPSALYSK